MSENYSVLMSLYYKENAAFFAQCMDSVLSQTVLPEEIVIVKDGPLTDELEQAVDKYVTCCEGMYTIVPLETNRGLGLALAEGIRHCRNELIARMDTDDIAVSDRFEKQLAQFEKDHELDICGGQILEFDGDPNNIISKRNVPLEDQEIKKYQKRRDAFNHVTVMYKKSAVLKAGNYQSALLMEDSLLWTNMILTGAKCMNLNCCLVYVRTGLDMFDRRGGLSYFKKYRDGRKKIRETGYIGWYDYSITVAIQFAVAIMPGKVRGAIFKKVLHR